MRALAFLLGITAVTGASAGEYAPYHDGDAVTAQVVYQARFGGEAGAPAVRSFQLQVANEAQRADGFVPMRAEYRFTSDLQSGRFLINGLDVERTLVARQNEEGGLASLWGGWFPLALVIGAATLIVVDGQDQDPQGTGSGP